MRRAIGLSLAPGTHKGYHRALRLFEQLRGIAVYPQSWPIPIDHVLHYAVHMKESGLSVGTIKGRLAALTFASKSLGYTECLNDFRVKKMLEGWRREEGPRKDPGKPLSPAILKGLFQQWRAVCMSEYERFLFHAASLIAFFGALRISKLVASSKSDLSGKAFDRDDVSVSSDQVHILIRSSKTDQSGKGRSLVLNTCDIAELCPVKALTQFLSVRKTGKGVLFCHVDGSPLTRYQFWVVTAKALRNLGQEGIKSGMHSFRIGAASSAAAMGYSVPRIQELGHWRSGAFRRYIRLVLF